jgi:hypothetical protein
MNEHGVLELYELTQRELIIKENFKIKKEKTHSVFFLL